MQLIPMILTVFLILSLMLATMQKISVQHTCITHRVMDHLAIESKLSEVAANQFFEKNQKQNQTTNTQKKTNSTKPFHSRRLEKGYLLNARLVIKDLLQNENKGLESVALAFLKELYENEKSIDPPTLLEEILHKGRDLLKSQPKIENFNLYDLKNPSKQLLKALQGTRGYSYELKNGYPPLCDYLEIYPKSNRQPVCAPFASLPLLIAVFGKKGAYEILDEEATRYLKEEKSPYLNLEQMRELFQKKSLKVPLEIFALISDKKMRLGKNHEIEMIVMDPKLQLEARGTLRTFPLKRDDLSGESQS